MRKCCAVCASNEIGEVEVKPYAFKFEGKEYKAKRVATRCWGCGFSWVDPHQIDRNHDTYYALVDSIAGYFSPDQVLTLREIYEISHEDASEVFGITEAQYIRYEHGEAEVPRELGTRMRAAMNDNEQVVNALVEIWRRRHQAQ